MEDFSQVIQSFDDPFDHYADFALAPNDARYSQKRTREASDDGEHQRGSASQTRWETGLLPWAQSNNQLEINNGVGSNGPNVITAQASQPTDIPNSTRLERNLSALSETERAERKKKNDQAYRERCKKDKEDMQLYWEKLTGENKSLKKENEPLKKDNASMNETLTEQAKEIYRLRSDLLQLKHQHEKQNVLVQTLSGLLSDPVRLENEKLKDENALLKENAKLNKLSLLAEENAKLKTENRVLKVQNDALCGKIISDNDKKREQK